MTIVEPKAGRVYKNGPVIRVATFEKWTGFFFKGLEKDQMMKFWTF